MSIVGARPQFVKAAVMSRAIRAHHDEVIVHTGQHYDAAMSAVFFEELSIPAPEIQLGAGSGSHGQQTAAMLVGIEQVLEARRPDWVVTFGDTNSTLAGALAAVKLQIPVAHVEAGLRSFNWNMPEEINRVLVDRMSTLRFCPSQTAVTNLASEGMHSGIHLVGDVMAEALAMAMPVARSRSTILAEAGVRDGAYILATVHRAENTDDPSRLRAIVDALNALTEPVVLPLHPRARKAIEAAGVVLASHVRAIGPVGYMDMVRLLTGARLVMTDSGGLQKEAYWAGVPCVTLRDETEWVETTECGWNVLVGASSERIIDAARTFAPAACRPPLYGGPGVAATCVSILERTSA
ncbi:MAG: UDP-N-acetylglucosamine 2-epimerase (non-hydrolyzing) [Vicinamibacterales bacterium]